MRSRCVQPNSRCAPRLQARKDELSCWRVPGGGDGRGISPEGNLALHLTYPLTVPWPAPSTPSPVGIVRRCSTRDVPWRRAACRESGARNSRRAHLLGPRANIYVVGRAGEYRRSWGNGRGRHASDLMPKDMARFGSQRSMPTDVGLRGCEVELRGEAKRP